MKKVYLRKGKEDSLLRFHPWVFSGAIAKVDEGIEEGDLVKVISSSGRFVAIGHFQIGSIAVRVLSFEDRDINRLFWEERISAAYEVRKSLHLLREDNNTFRLIHGEGDLLPGLIIDIYGDSAVIQAHSVGMHYVRQTIAEILIATVDGLKNVYYKSETTLPFKAELNDAKENGYLIGSMSDAVGIENGVKFHIDWLRGQKTGFFIDQRENRALLEHYSTGKKVLNMFCYTGGFSCYAMRGGAELVHSVDSSSKAIDLTNKNIELNFQDTSRHQSFAVDAF